MVTESEETRLGLVWIRTCAILVVGRAPHRCANRSLIETFTGSVANSDDQPICIHVPANHDKRTATGRGSEAARSDPPQRRRWEIGGPLPPWNRNLKAPTPRNMDVPPTPDEKVVRGPSPESFKNISWYQDSESKALRAQFRCTCSTTSVLFSSLV